MRFFPHDRQTVVSPYTPEEIRNKFETALENERIADPFLRRAKIWSGERTGYRMQGKLTKSGFRVSLLRQMPEHFMPEAMAKMEPTSQGTLVFIRYRLPGGTRFFLGLSVGIALFVSGVFLLLQKNVFSFVLLAVFALGSYSVLLLNFEQKLRLLRMRIDQVLA